MATAESHFVAMSEQREADKSISKFIKELGNLYPKMTGHFGQRGINLSKLVILLVSADKSAIIHTYRNRAKPFRNMMIVDKDIKINELKQVAAAGFGNLVKAVVDVDRELLALDAELHSDLEALLLENGSKQIIR